MRVQPRKVVVNGAKGLLGTPTGRLFRGHADIELNALDLAERCAESRKQELEGPVTKPAPEGRRTVATGGAKRSPWAQIPSNNSPSRRGGGSMPLR